MAQYGKFGKIDAAIAHFIHEHMEEIYCRTEPPAIISLTAEFTNFLVDNGTNRLYAQEVSEKYSETVSRRLSISLDEWELFTEAQPVTFLPERNDLISWHHPRRDELAESALLSHDFISAYRRILHAESREFLFIVSIYLARNGFDKIFITDGSGDMGTDLLARKRSGAFENVILFVQSKTSRSDRISADTLFQEFGKMKACPATEKYRFYLDLVENEKSVCGSGRLFGLFSNREFRDSARSHAANLGMMLRSGRQIARSIGFSGVNLARKLFDAYERREIAVKSTDNLRDIIELVEMERIAN